MTQIPITISGTWQGDAALRTHSKMIATRLEEIIQGGYGSGFVDNGGRKGWPSNISGRHFNTFNAFILLLDSDKNNYATRIYLTKSEAKANGLTIKNQAMGVPILLFDAVIKPKNVSGRIKSPDYPAWMEMPAEERDDYECIIFASALNVFNLDMTDIAELSPDLYINILSKFNARNIPDKGVLSLSDYLENAGCQVDDSPAAALAWEICQTVLAGSHGTDAYIDKRNYVYTAEWIDELNVSSKFLLQLLPLVGAINKLIINNNESLVTVLSNADIKEIAHG